MKQPNIDLFYLPVSGKLSRNAVFGPGELRPAWIRVEYDRRVDPVLLAGLEPAELQDKPIFLRLQLENQENKYRHMFELPDGKTHYFIPTEPLYSEYADFYDELASVWQEFDASHHHEQFGDWLADGLKQAGVAKTARILNISKAPMTANEALSTAGYTNQDYYLISPKMVELAHNFPGYTGKSMSWGSLLNLPTNEKYDAIVGVQTLQYYLRDADRLLASFAEVLNPGGVVVTSDIYSIPGALNYFEQAAYSFDQMMVDGKPIRRMARNVLRNPK